jgi:hypothetical protein
MLIAFGNATDLGNNGLSFIAGDPPFIGPRAVHTAPHTLGAGSNVLLVAVEGAFPPVDDITSVTYGGYSLVELAKYVPQPEDNQRCLYLYGAVDPPAGTNDVIAECAGNHYLAVLAMDYSGASAADISIARNVAPQGSTELTTTINVIQPDSWVALLESGYDEDVAQPGTGVVGPRTYGQQWGSPSFFDSGGAVPPGDYQFTTYRTPPHDTYPGILHLAIAFAPADSTPPAAGPIAFNGAADLGENSGATNQLTGSYTVGADSNLLFVCVWGDTLTVTQRPTLAVPPATASDFDDIESVTFAGQPLDLLLKTSPPPDFEAEGERYIYLYYLRNPAAGTHDVVITAGNVHYLGGIAGDYAGAGAFSESQINFDVGATWTLTTAFDITVPDSWIILFEAGYSTFDGLADSPDLTRRVSGVFLYPTLFDSNGRFLSGVYNVTTTRPPATPVISRIVHLGLVVAPLGTAQPVAVDLDPARHAPVEVSGNLAARVFPRPIGVSLDPATHPRVEISSR